MVGAGHDRTQSQQDSNASPQEEQQVADKPEPQRSAGLWGERGLYWEAQQLAGHSEGQPLFLPVPVLAKLWKQELSGLESAPSPCETLVPGQWGS